jgi:hypothetical protein
MLNIQCQTRNNFFLIKQSHIHSAPPVADPHLLSQVHYSQEASGVVVKYHFCIFLSAE